MAGRVDYKPPRRRFADVANGTEIRRSLRQVAGKGKQHAESISPVDTGLYKSSFEVNDTTSAQLAGTGPAGAIETAAVELVNTTDYAVFVEHGNGTAKFRGYHIMRRTLDFLATGGRT